MSISYSLLNNHIYPSKGTLHRILDWTSTPWREAFGGKRIAVTNVDHNLLQSSTCQRIMRLVIAIIFVPAAIVSGVALILKTISWICGLKKDVSEAHKVYDLWLATHTELPPTPPETPKGAAANPGNDFSQDDLQDIQDFNDAFTAENYDEALELAEDNEDICKDPGVARKLYQILNHYITQEFTLTRLVELLPLLDDNVKKMAIIEKAIPLLIRKEIQRKQILTSAQDIYDFLESVFENEDDSIMTLALEKTAALLLQPERADNIHVEDAKLELWLSFIEICVEKLEPEDERQAKMESHLKALQEALNCGKKGSNTTIELIKKIQYQNGQARKINKINVDFMTWQKETPNILSLVDKLEKRFTNDLAEDSRAQMMALEICAQIKKLECQPIKALLLQNVQLLKKRLGELTIPDVRERLKHEEAENIYAEVRALETTARIEVLTIDASQHLIKSIAQCCGNTPYAPTKATMDTDKPAYDVSEAAAPAEPESPTNAEMDTPADDVSEAEAPVEPETPPDSK